LPFRRSYPCVVLEVKLAAKAFSRHSSIAVLDRYLHAAEDAAGKMAELASESLDGEAVS